MKTLKISPKIHLEIATAIVKQSHPGYDSRYFGESFAVDTDGDGIADMVFFREGNAAWDPWPDSAVAVSVEEVFYGCGASFDPTPDDDDGIEPDDSPAWDDAEQAAIDLALDYIPEEVEFDE